MISVLLADDHELMRKAIASLLAGNPEIEVVAEAASFTQTMELLTNLHPKIIVLDLHMGDERLVSPSLVKSCLNGSRLLAMSIWTDDEAKSLAETFGAVTLLDKTNLATQLIPAIKQYARECDAAPDGSAKLTV
jgi:two-component system response regulator DevR